MSKPLRLKLPAAVLLLGLAGPSGAANEFYCCIDPANGRRACGDVLPAQCRTQAYRVFDKGGNLLREVAAPLTAEQKAAAREEAQRKKQLEAARREQQRLDQALLDTYSSPDEIDRAQAKAEHEVNLAIQATQEKMIKAQKTQQKLLAEAEFYKRSPPPPTIETHLRTVNRELVLHQEVMEGKKRELLTLQARFDTERQRYQALTGRQTTGSRPPAVTPPASPSTNR